MIPGCSESSFHFEEEPRMAIKYHPGQQDVAVTTGPIRGRMAASQTPKLLFMAKSVSPL